jgi:dTDP-4-amino-4,6-dideoxygalactose transaminase
VPYVPPYATHSYQSYCVRLTSDARVGRDALMEALLRRGIATRRGVMASHLEKAYLDRVGRVSLPVTEEAARATMDIPLYAAMTEDEQGYVIDALREELGPA